MVSPIGWNIRSIDNLKSLVEDISGTYSLALVPLSPVLFLFLLNSNRLQTIEIETKDKEIIQVLAEKKKKKSNFFLFLELEELLQHSGKPEIMDQN